jgi:hypothetical protein
MPLDHPIEPGASDGPSCKAVIGPWLRLLISLPRFESACRLGQQGVQQTLIGHSAAQAYAYVLVPRSGTRFS